MLRDAPAESQKRAIYPCPRCLLVVESTDNQRHPRMEARWMFHSSRFAIASLGLGGVLQASCHREDTLPSHA